MSTVAEHYAAGGPVAKVTAALDQLAGAPGGSLTLDQLTGFDHFHTAGAIATSRMAELLAPASTDTVLDAGAGVGGPARALADRFGCQVIGVDLTPDFVQIGRLINDRTGLGDRVELRVGDITALDIDDASIDHAWTQHVAMNIADRVGLYRELRRVLRPGGRFALFDVIDGGGGDLLLPVPWATKPEHSHLVTRDELRALLEASSFRIEVWDDPTAEMLEMMRAMVAGPPGGASGPPLLGPFLIIDDFATKGASYTRNMAEGRTALALAVCTAI